MTRQAARLSLQFCVSFPRERELLPRCCHPMSPESRRRLPRFAAWRTVSAVPYGSRLPCPRGQRRRGTSPVWMKHPCLQMMTPITRSAGEDTRIASLRETQPGPGQLLRRQGGGSQGHSGQRATLRSNAGWPLRYAPYAGTHWLRSPGAGMPPEFCQRFLHKYGLAQVGLSLCYQH